MTNRDICISIFIGLGTGLISGLISGYLVSIKFYKMNKQEQFEKDKNNLISYLIKLLYLDNENNEIEDVKEYLKLMPDYNEFNGYTSNNKQLFRDLYFNIKKIENSENMKQFKEYAYDLGEIIIKLQMLKYN